MGRRTDSLIDQLRAQARGRDVRSFRSYQDPAYQRDAYDRDVLFKGGTGFRSNGIVNGGGLPMNSPTPGNVESQAQFGITCKRLTATIAADLPAPIFNPIDAENAYASMLSGELPPGVSILSCVYGSAAGKPASLTISFTDGVHTDAIDVSCSAIPYPGFLKSLLTDKFEINKVRMTLSDDAQTSQFQKQLKVKSRSPFGLGSENGAPPSDFRSPQQYQAGIVDIDLKFKFDKQTGIALPIIPVAAFSVNLSFFSPRFSQESARFW